MRSRGGWRPIFNDSSRYVDRFGLLLIASAGTIVVLALIDLSQPEDQVLGRGWSVIASALVAITLTLALRASGLNGRLQRVVDVVLAAMVAVLAVIASGTTVLSEAYTPTPAPVFVVALSVLAPLVVVRRLIHHREATQATVMGAISGYLLIAVAFFYVFLYSQELTGQFFAEPQPSTSFMYFSLTSITTVGYGDLVALSNLDRLLANAEAVIGQVYLVTFVALIVGLYAAQRAARGSGQESADESL